MAIFSATKIIKTTYDRYYSQQQTHSNPDDWHLNIFISQMREISEQENIHKEITDEAIEWVERLRTLDFISVIGRSEQEPTAQRVYVHNPVARGHFLIKSPDSPELPTEYVKGVLGTFSFNVLFAMYRIVQQRNWQTDPKEFQSLGHFSFSFKEIEKQLQSKHKNIRKQIEDALENIYHANIVLRNFVMPSPTTGELEKYRSYQTRIISSKAEYGKDRFSVFFTPAFMLPILRKKSNMTVIDLQLQNKLRSPHAQQLYHFLESFKSHKEVVISKQTLCELYGTDKATTSELNKRTTRAKKSLETVYERVDFAWNKDKEKITFRVYR